MNISKCNADVVTTLVLENGIENRISDVFESQVPIGNAIVVIKENKEFYGIVTYGDYRRAIESKTKVLINVNSKRIVLDNTILEQLFDIEKKYPKIHFLPVISPENNEFMYCLEMNVVDNSQLNSQYDFLEKLGDYIKHEVIQSEEIVILDVHDSLELLAQKKKSFVRIGDGEIEIIKGNSIAFQKYDERLADYLRKILIIEREDLEVGIVSSLFNTCNNTLPSVRKFYLMNRHKYSGYLLSIINKRRKYFDTSCNQVYNTYLNMDFEGVYDKWKKLFEGKNIVLFHGRGILNKIKYNILEVCKSIEYVEGPNIDAFVCFDELLEQSKKYSREKVLCYILGPTSKALVYELSMNGYTAWDLGHLIKDYDSYKRRVERVEENINSFYKPD